MTISVVQHHEAYLSGFVSNPYSLINLTSTSIPTVSNSVILQVTCNGGGPFTSFTDNYGNSFTKIIAASDSSTGYNHSEADIWWIPSFPAGGSGTYTISANITGPGAGGSPNISVIEASGLSAAVDHSGTANDGGGGTATGATVTASGANTNANCLVLAHIYTTFGHTINQPPTTGYTTTLNGSDSISGGYKIVSALETSSGAWAWTTGAWAAAAIATFGAQTPPGTQAPIYYRKNVLYFI